MAKYNQGVKVQNIPALSAVCFAVFGIIMSIAAVFLSAPISATAAITFSLFGVVLAILSLRL
ncbi:membrane protein [Arthrobacter phage Racecar]|nr:hypothetical protein PBI_RACECAR_139 [Arthrobacter phage Racecar]QFG12813.1 hypothetical protein PBI_MIMI_136 [Arthrobacter phage Mimi]